MEQGSRCCWLAVRRQDHTFWDRVRDDFLRITIASLFTITGERGRAISQPIHPIRLGAWLADAVVLLDHPLGVQRAHAYGAFHGRKDLPMAGHRSWRTDRGARAWRHHTRALRMAFPCRRKSMHCGSTRRPIRKRPSMCSGPCFGRRPGSRRTLVTPGR